MKSGMRLTSREETRRSHHVKSRTQKSGAPIVGALAQRLQVPAGFGNGPCSVPLRRAAANRGTINVHLQYYLSTNDTVERWISGPDDDCQHRSCRKLLDHTVDVPINSDDHSAMERRCHSDWAKRYCPERFL